MELVQAHPAIVSIEDGLAEQDYANWISLTRALGDKIMLVGDDLYTTNTRLIAQGLEHSWANALLLKVNQIGAVSEAMAAARMLFERKQKVIVSHRSGETTSALILFFFFFFLPHGCDCMCVLVWLSVISLFSIPNGLMSVLPVVDLGHCSSFPPPPPPPFTTITTTTSTSPSFPSVPHTTHTPDRFGHC